MATIGTSVTPCFTSLTIPGAEPHDWRVRPEHVEEAEWRGVNHTGCVDCRHPCDRSRGHQGRKHRIGAVGMFSFKIEFHAGRYVWRRSPSSGYDEACSVNRVFSSGLLLAGKMCTGVGTCLAGSVPASLPGLPYQFHTEDRFRNVDGFVEIQGCCRPVGAPFLSVREKPSGRG